MTEFPVEIGAIVAITMALIKLIEYLIGKFTQNNSKDTYDRMSLEKMSSQLELMNTNHLNHIESAINDGNNRLVSAIQAMHMDIIKELNRKQ